MIEFSKNHQKTLFKQFNDRTDNELGTKVRDMILKTKSHDEFLFTLSNLLSADKFGVCTL